MNRIRPAVPRLVLLVSCCLFPAIGAWGDDGQLASDREYLGRITPVLPGVGQVGVTVFPDIDLSGGEGSLSFEEYQIEGAPFFRALGGGFGLAAGVYYEFTRLDIDTPVLADDLDLHRLEVPLLLSWSRPDSRWRGFVRVSGKVQTDGDASWSDALGGTVMGVVMRRVGDDLALGLGAYYDYSLGEHFVVGGPGFTWAPTERFALGLIGPRLTANYGLTDRWRVRFEAAWRSPKWVLGSSEAGDDVRVEVSGLRLGGSLERRVFEGERLAGWLGLRGGYQVAGEVEIRDSGNRGIYAQDLEGSYYVGLGMRIEMK